MPPYTASSLIAFLQTEFGAIGRVMQLTNDQYNEIVNEVLLLLDAETLAGYTTSAALLRVRRVARLVLWRMALRVAATLYDTDFGGVEGGSNGMQRSQIFDQIRAALQDAEYEVAQGGDVPGSTLDVYVGAVRWTYAGDPYRYDPTI